MQVNRVLTVTMSTYGLHVVAQYQGIAYGRIKAVVTEYYPISMTDRDAPCAVDKHLKILLMGYVLYSALFKLP